MCLGCNFFEKNLVIFEISTIKIFKNKFLAKTVNFTILYAFLMAESSFFLKIQVWGRFIS